MKMKSNLLGVGIDIIEIERLRKSIAKHPRLLDRLFSAKEQKYCMSYKDPTRHFAGRFAAKEAIAKALGCGFGKRLSWLDLEILSEASGQPKLLYSEKVNRDFGSPHILLSLSHCKLYATAIAILQAEKLG